MTSLLRGSDAHETRTLSRIGEGVAACLAVAVAVYFVAGPFGGTPKNVISVAIETPYVGQGVASGTPLIMHGVKVGEVTALASAPGGGVRLNADLQPGFTSGLTDAMGIDFRPANYFGVTGINLIPADGGQPLRSGADISVTPKPHYGADGNKAFDIQSTPEPWAEDLQRQLGKFPFQTFWGPMAALPCTQWIAVAAPAMRRTSGSDSGCVRRWTSTPRLAQ